MTNNSDDVDLDGEPSILLTSALTYLLPSAADVIATRANLRKTYDCDTAALQEYLCVKFRKYLTPASTSISGTFEDLARILVAQGMQRQKVRNLLSVISDDAPRLNGQWSAKFQLERGRMTCELLLPRRIGLSGPVPLRIEKTRLEGLLIAGSPSFEEFRASRSCKSVRASQLSIRIVARFSKMLLLEATYLGVICKGDGDFHRMTVSTLRSMSALTTACALRRPLSQYRQSAKLNDWFLIYENEQSQLVEALRSRGLAVTWLEHPPLRELDLHPSIGEVYPAWRRDSYFSLSPGEEQSGKLYPNVLEGTPYLHLGPVLFFYSEDFWEKFQSLTSHALRADLLEGSLETLGVDEEIARKAGDYVRLCGTISQRYAADSSVKSPICVSTEDAEIIYRPNGRGNLIQWQRFSCEGESISRTLAGLLNLPYREEIDSVAIPCTYRYRREERLNVPFTVIGAEAPDAVSWQLELPELADALRAARLVPNCNGRWLVVKIEIGEITDEVRSQQQAVENQWDSDTRMEEDHWYAKIENDVAVRTPGIPADSSVDDLEGLGLLKRRPVNA